MADELIKILLVDDDEEDYIITREVLSEIEDRRFDIEWVANYDAALEVIDTSRFDVCLETRTETPILPKSSFS